MLTITLATLLKIDNGGKRKRRNTIQEAILIIQIRDDSGLDLDGSGRGRG